MASPSYRATTHSFLLSYIYNKLRRWIVLYYATTQYFIQTLVPVGCGWIGGGQDCSQSVLQVGSFLHTGQSWSSHQAAHANQQVKPAINHAHTHTHSKKTAHILGGGTEQYHIYTPRVITLTGENFLQSLTQHNMDDGYTVLAMVDTCVFKTHELLKDLPPFCSVNHSYWYGIHKLRSCIVFMSPVLWREG